MKFNQATSTQKTNGNEAISGHLPLRIRVPVSANQQKSFKVDSYGSQGKKKPRLAATLDDSHDNELFSSIDQRLLGGDQPHFQVVGKPKHTSTSMDKEIDPQDVFYTISSLDPSDDVAGFPVVIQILHA